MGTGDVEDPHASGVACQVLPTATGFRKRHGWDLVEARAMRWGQREWRTRPEARRRPACQQQPAVVRAPAGHLRGQTLSESQRGRRRPTAMMVAESVREFQPPADSVPPAGQ